MLSLPDGSRTIAAPAHSLMHINLKSDMPQPLFCPPRLSSGFSWRTRNQFDPNQATLSGLAVRFRPPR